MQSHTPEAGNGPLRISPSLLRVVSYNVQFLPGLARYTNKRAQPAYRAKQIAAKMSAFDIVGLNETFDDEPRKLIIIIGQPKRTAPALQVSEIQVNPYLDDKVQALSDHSAVEATLKWNHRPPVSARNGGEGIGVEATTPDRMARCECAATAPPNLV